MQTVPGSHLFQLQELDIMKRTYLTLIQKGYSLPEILPLGLQRLCWSGSVELLCRSWQPEASAVPVNTERSVASGANSVLKRVGTELQASRASLLHGFGQPIGGGNV